MATKCVASARFVAYIRALSTVCNAWAQLKPCQGESEKEGGGSGKRETYIERWQALLIMSAGAGDWRLRLRSRRCRCTSLATANIISLKICNAFGIS